MKHLCRSFQYLSLQYTQVAHAPQNLKRFSGRVFLEHEKNQRWSLFLNLFKIRQSVEPCVLYLKFLQLEQSNLLFQYCYAQVDIGTRSLCSSFPISVVAALCDTWLHKFLYCVWHKPFAGLGVQLLFTAVLLQQEDSSKDRKMSSVSLYLKKVDSIPKKKKWDWGHINNGKTHTKLSDSKGGKGDHVISVLWDFHHLSGLSHEQPDH